MRSITVTLIPVLLGLAAVAGAQEQMPSADQGGYLVNAGDRLEISVWKEPDLQREVLVRPDGAFSFPLAGQIMAEGRSEEHTSELQSRENLVCRLLLEKKKK